MENTIIIKIEEKNNGVNPRYTFSLHGNAKTDNGYELVKYTVEKHRAAGTLYEHMDKLAIELGEKYPTTAVFFTTA